MTLYYHKDNYQIKDLDPLLVEGWIENNNPKINQWELLPQQPSAGHIWQNGSWILPDSISIIPESISARQIRLWLIRHGIALSAVDDAINSIPDQTIRESVRVEWEYAPYIERNHPMLQPLAANLGLLSTDIDNAFIEAQNI